MCPSNLTNNPIKLVIGGIVLQCGHTKHIKDNKDSQDNAAPGINIFVSMKMLLMRFTKDFRQAQSVQLSWNLTDMYKSLIPFHGL